MILQSFLLPAMALTVFFYAVYARYRGLLQASERLIETAKSMVKSAVSCAPAGAMAHSRNELAPGLLEACGQKLAAQMYRSKIEPWANYTVTVVSGPGTGPRVLPSRTEAMMRQAIVQAIRLGIKHWDHAIDARQSTSQSLPDSLLATSSAKMLHVHRGGVRGGRSPFADCARHNSSQQKHSTSPRCRRRPRVRRWSGRRHCQFESRCGHSPN